MALAVFVAPGAAAAAERRTPILKPARMALRAEMVMNYAVTMAAHRQDLLQAAKTVPQRMEMPGGPRWRWRADDGSVVQRVGDGQFRLTVGDCVGNLCMDIDCQVTLWPQLICADGRERKISAPDMYTVILDGQTFRRTLKMVAKPEPAPGETN